MNRTTFYSAIVEKFRRPYRRPPIRFTRFGIFFILFSLGVGAAAINTGNNLLYLILGILLGIIVVSGILSDSSLWNFRSYWQPLDDLYAGQASLWRVESSKGKFPAVLVSTAGLWHNGNSKPRLTYWISPHGQAHSTHEVTPLRRGFLTLYEIQTSTLFPFGLFEKKHTYQTYQRWVVYPQVKPIPATQLQAMSSHGLETFVSQVGQGAVPFSVRDYRTGDPARRIDWKTSLRSGRLWVHEMEAEAEHSVILGVKRWPTEFSKKRQEEFISFLASWCKSLVDAGLGAGLLTPDNSIPAGSGIDHLRVILGYLALIDLASLPSTRSDIANTPSADALKLFIEQANG